MKCKLMKQYHPRTPLRPNRRNQYMRQSLMPIPEARSQYQTRLWSLKPIPGEVLEGAEVAANARIYHMIGANTKGGLERCRA